jgi:hypothetical protein
LPPGIQAAGKAAKVVGNAALKSSDALKSFGGKVADTVLPSGKGISQEVKDLAKKAQKYGIDIPIDKISKSKVGNAAAKTLEYIPFAGREGTIEKMHKQVNKAVSRTIGQDNENINKALRDADVNLSGQFEKTLKENTVKVDDQLIEGLGKVEKEAESILVKDQFLVIKKQIDNILEKGSSGQLDGEAAYNIKKLLDKLGKGSDTTKASVAIDLKKELMAALDRSLGTEKSAAFKKVREQYGNMLELEKIAMNGAEGEISIARLSNMKNVQSKELKDLADIAAQFVKEKEGQHGAAQRAATAAVVAATTNPATLALMSAGGRAANMTLNSKAIRNRMIGNVAKKAPKARDFSRLKKTGKGAASLALRSAPALIQQQTRQQQ